jgi:hypothetical protein
VAADGEALRMFVLPKRAGREHEPPILRVSKGVTIVSRSSAVIFAREPRDDETYDGERQRGETVLDVNACRPWLESGDERRK